MLRCLAHCRAPLRPARGSTAAPAAGRGAHAAAGAGAAVAARRAPRGAAPRLAAPLPAHRSSLLRSLLVACPIAGLSQRAAAMSGTAAAAASTSGGGDSPTGAIVVYVTVPDQKTADHLSDALVSSHLAACVNIVPGLTSVYWWDGKVNRDSELLLVIKTKGTYLAELTAQVKRLHPYDEPEVVALPIQGGSASYLQWLHDSAAKPDLAALSKVQKLPG